MHHCFFSFCYPCCPCNPWLNALTDHLVRQKLTTVSPARVAVPVNVSVPVPPLSSIVVMAALSSSVTESAPAPILITALSTRFPDTLLLTPPFPAPAPTP